MGWWSYGVLGGDEPLDTLGDLGDRLGIELYPLDLSDTVAASVRAKLEEIGDDFITDPRFGKLEALPVVASVFVHTGATMSEGLKNAMLGAIHGDVFGGPEWGGEEDARLSVMSGLAATVENHKPGQRQSISQRGLMEALEEHVQSGKHGLINMHKG